MSVPGAENDLLPREQVLQRPEPRPRSTVGPSASSDAADGAATLRRKPRPLVTEPDALAPGASTVVTMTTGSDTVRRKPRASEHTERAVQSGNQVDAGREAQQNDGVVLRRRPASEASDRTEQGQETCEWMEARRSLRPPVSPKPAAVNLRKTQADPPTPTRRVPIPGPETAETAQSPGETPSPPHRHLLQIQPVRTFARKRACAAAKRTTACSLSEQNPGSAFLLLCRQNRGDLPPPQNQSKLHRQRPPAQRQAVPPQFPNLPLPLPLPLQPLFQLPTLLPPLPSPQDSRLRPPPQHRAPPAPLLTL